MASSAGAPSQILVLCTGNSCRSILAEALFRDLGGDRVEVVSAGSHPAGPSIPGRPGPRGGRDRSLLGSVEIDDGVPGTTFDHVLTVCDDAAEACPCSRARRSGRIGASRTLPRRPARKRSCSPSTGRPSPTFASGSRASSLPSTGEPRSRGTDPALPAAACRCRRSRGWKGTTTSARSARKGKVRPNASPAFLHGVRLGVDAVISSPKVRARRTAEIVAGGLGATVRLDDRLAGGSGRQRSMACWPTQGHRVASSSSATIPTSATC